MHWSIFWGPVVQVVLTMDWFKGKPKPETIAFTINILMPIILGTW